MSLGHKAESGAAALTSVGRSHRGESVVHAHARKCKPGQRDNDHVNCTAFHGSFDNPEFLDIKILKIRKKKVYTNRNHLI